MSNQTQKTLGHVPVSTPKLALVIKSAVVRIRHEERSDILVTVNEPENWLLHEGAINQTKVTAPSGNSASHTVTVSSGSNKTIVSTVSGVGNIVSGTGDVFINGDKVTVQGDKSPVVSVTSLLERLEVLVPRSYVGELELTTDGSHTTRIDFWHGDKLTINAQGSGSLLVEGHLEVKSFLANAAGSFSGSLEIESLVCQTGKFDMVGYGVLNLRSLEAGELTLRVAGDGDATINVLKAQKVTAEHSGDGEIFVLSGTAREVHFDSFGSGDAVMWGQFDHVVERIHGKGMVRIRAPRT